MVHANVDESMIKEPHREITKGKEECTSSARQQQNHQQQHSKKDDKYGAWGPVFKNKENFVNMHIC